MIKGINKNQIETIIEQHLSEMFNRSANVRDTIKNSIKSKTIKLSQEFIDIISEFNTDIDNDSFVDRVMDKIEDFVAKYSTLINSINDKKIASSVGAIWYAFFIQAQKELDDNISDKMFFQYGEQEINKLLISRMQKK